MNKAKRIYVDKDGNMVRDSKTLLSLWNDRDRKRYYRDFKEVPIPDGYVDKGDLYLVEISRTKHGVTFWFKDDGGAIFPMIDTELIEWVKDHPIKFGDATWCYKQQGYVYSISFEGENSNEDN